MQNLCIKNYTFILLIKLRLLKFAKIKLMISCEKLPNSQNILFLVTLVYVDSSKIDCSEPIGGGVGKQRLCVTLIDFLPLSKTSWQLLLILLLALSFLY